MLYHSYSLIFSPLTSSLSRWWQQTSYNRPNYNFRKKKKRYSCNFKSISITWIPHLDKTNWKPKKTVNTTHPLCIPLCQVIIDGYNYKERQIPVKFMDQKVLTDITQIQQDVKVLNFFYNNILGLDRFHQLLHIIFPHKLTSKSSFISNAPMFMSHNLK